jgi:hypothetical protein
MICLRCGALVVEDRCGGIHDSMSAQTNMVKDDGLILETTTEPDYCDDEVHLGSESYIAGDVDWIAWTDSIALIDSRIR